MATGRNTSRKLSDAVNIRPVEFVGASPDGWPEPFRPVGVEIELENVPDGGITAQREMRFGDYWALHREGSLRNGGAEFVFRDPVPAYLSSPLLADLCEYAREHRYDPSWRAGIHVHVQAVDLTPEEMYRLFLIYSLYEPSLFYWIGGDRAKTRFCKPWYSSAAHLLPMMKSLSIPDLKQGLVKVEEDVKYSALNVASLWRYGTVEFRHLGATLDEQRITIWIHLLLKMFDSAKKMTIPLEEFVGAYESMGAEAFTREIWGEYASTLQQSPTFNADLRKGRYTCINLRGHTLNQLAGEASEDWETLSDRAVNGNDFVRRFKAKRKQENS